MKMSIRSLGKTIGGLLISLSIAATGGAQTCTHPDYTPLMALYQSTDGDSWSISSNWDVGCPCDAANPWHGITCTDGRVTSIILTGNSLQGSIPSEIGQLTELRDLYLSDNQLEDVIPNELYGLTGLRRLSLSQNMLQGGISPQLGQLKELRSLFISRNNLIGSIPEEIGRLSHLEEFLFSQNSLSGALPNSLAALRSLTHLQGHSNLLTGRIPQGVFSMDRLKVVWLANNDLSAHLDASIGGMTSLITLHLDGVEINGPLPSEIGSLPQLTAIFLNGCGLTGSLPSTLAELDNLETLFLSDNNLTGCWPPLFHTRCAQLHSYSFDGNSGGQISNAGWSSYCSSGGVTGGQHPDYEALIALYQATQGDSWGRSDNWDTGDGASSCDPCLDEWYGVDCDEISHRVVSLQLTNNNLVGEIPDQIGLLDHLISMSLYGNMLSGAIPESIGLLRGLTVLDLGNNNLSGTLPEGLGKLTLLRDLYLDDNDLNGCWPNRMADLCQNDPTIRVFANGNSSTNISNTGWEAFCDDEIGIMHDDYMALEDLYVSTQGDAWHDNTKWSISNSCADPCDDDWYGVTCDETGSRVTLIDLNSNRLVGPIPETIGDLDFLEEIDLSSNSLSGSIPGSVGDLFHLKHLNLNFNKLSGEIPEEVFGMSNLQSLFLKRNLLTGSTPRYLNQAPDLEELDLSFNVVSGTVFEVISPAIKNIFLNDNYYTQAYGFRGGENVELIDLSNNNIDDCYGDQWWSLCATDVIIGTMGNPGLGDWYDYCNNGAIGACDACIAEDLMVPQSGSNPPEIHDLYHHATATQSLKADVRISDPKHVLFRAGEQVELLPDFELSHGATLQAVIRGCVLSVPSIIADQEVKK